MANEGLTLVRDRWYTALTADVTSAATTLPVATNTVGGNVLPTPCIIMCGFEQMYATASTATTITVTRGFASTAAAHAKGATVGIARVAAHHNDMVAALAGVSTQSAVAVGTSNTITTTSASYVDMTDMSVTLTTTGGDLLVWFMFAYSHSALGGVVQIALRLDAGSNLFDFGINEPVAGYVQSYGTIGRFTGVSAGSHTVKARWLTNAATATANLNQRYLMVLEL